MRSWGRVARGGAALVLLLSTVACGRTADPAPEDAVLVVDRRDPACADEPSRPTGPFCTINAAAARVLPGQSVLVRPGTYNEQVEPPISGTADKPIVITADPSAPVVVTGRRHGFKLVSKSYVSIEGFVVEATAGSGVSLSASDHVSIVGLTVDRSGEEDREVACDGIAVSASRDVAIIGNDVSRSNRSGIFLDATSSSAIVERNLVVGNGLGRRRAGVGIDVRGDNNIVRHNVGRDNQDSGLQFHEGASDNVAAGNLFVGNKDHGIDVANSPQQHLVGNTLVENVASGANVEGAASTGTVIANNIVVDNGTGGADAANIRVTAPALEGTTADNNLVRGRPPGAFYVWASKGFSDLAGVRSVGQEVAGRQGDPQFTDRASFAVAPRSPAVDAANEMVVGHSPVDRFGRARVGSADLGTLEVSPAPPAPRVVRTIPTAEGRLVAWRPETSALDAAHEVVVGGRTVVTVPAGGVSALLPPSTRGAVGVRTVTAEASSEARATSTPSGA